MLAAARVFPARGYHQTRVEEVAEGAGRSIGEQHAERRIAELELRVLERDRPAARVTAAGRRWAAFMESEQDWISASW